MRPSDVTASFEPSGRGALRRVRDDGRERDLLARRAPFLCLCEHLVHVAMMPAMNAQAGDELDALLARVDAGELGDPLPVLAYLAGQAVELDDEELNGARRRALLLVAAGGDPHRDLEVDDRAVKALAADLYDRRAPRAARRGASTRSSCACASCRSRARPRSSSPPTSISPGGCSRSALLAEELAG